MGRLTREARAILRRARRRYRRQPPARRPRLDCPASYVGLFGAEDLVALARCGLWPLPSAALAWLAAGPRPGPSEALWRDLLVLAERSPGRVQQLLRALLWPRKAVGRG